MGDSHGSRYRCNSCRMKGVFDCNHCFKCGSVDHIITHCRKRQNQGNWIGLLQGGRRQLRIQISPVAVVKGM